MLAPLLIALLAADAPPLTPDPGAELARLSLEEILTRGKRTLSGMGVYRYTVVKQERIDHHLSASETLELTVQERPYAMRLDETAGSAKGRRIIYNSTLRPDEFRVREPGVASMLGALWIGVHSSLARRGTNHVVTDSGFGHLLDATGSDLDQARPYGGRKRVEEGPDAEGRYCIRSQAPPQAAASSYSVEGKVCYDPKTYLPLTVDIWDAEGLLETYRYSNLQTHLELGDTYFTPEAAGL